MARKGREGVLKRQRERKKAEKAELKRAERAERHAEPSEEGSEVASDDDLAGYGHGPPPVGDTGRD